MTGFFKHLFVHPTRFTLATGPSALFLPVKIASRVPLLDCDYNLHKSNSTYFADFDMARLHLLLSLVSSGMAKTSEEIGSKWPISIKLGGASCNFRREIKPYQGFEVWSRVLSWDQKWLYVISHFVKKGSVRPRGYVLQPWRKIKVTRGKKEEESRSHNQETVANGDLVKSAPNSTLFATAIAKYVFKHGRLTIPPERVLRNANLLPPKPEIAPSPPISTSPSLEATSLDASLISAIPDSLLSSNAENTVQSEHETPGTEATTDIWDWDRTEKERARGWKMAEMYAGLEALNDECTYDGGWALGEYKDLY